MTDTTETEPTRKTVAKHIMLDSTGAEAQSEESAVGYRYHQIATGNSVTIAWDDLPADAQRMVGLFGIKTLATNEASQVRNDPKGGGDDAEQLAAIEARFDLLKTGTWVDRTRDGVGAKVDKDKLAQAICDVLVADGKLAADTVAVTLPKVRAKLESDATYQRTARQVPGVNGRYAELIGRTTRTTDDLLASLA